MTIEEKKRRQYKVIYLYTQEKPQPNRGITEHAKEREYRFEAIRGKATDPGQVVLYRENNGEYIKQIHYITNRAEVIVQDYHTHKLVTAMFLSPGQLVRYNGTMTSDMVAWARDNDEHKRNEKK